MQQQNENLVGPVNVSLQSQVRTRALIALSTSFILCFIFVFMGFARSLNDFLEVLIVSPYYVTGTMSIASFILSFTKYLEKVKNIPQTAFWVSVCSFVLSWLILIILDASGISIQ